MFTDKFVLSSFCMKLSSDNAALGRLTPQDLTFLFRVGSSEALLKLFSLFTTALIMEVKYMKGTELFRFHLLNRVQTSC